MPRLSCWLLLVALGCSGATKPPETADPSSSKAPPLTPQARLEAAQKALHESNYPKALQLFGTLQSESCCAKVARLGLAEVLLTSGRYADVLGALGDEAGGRAGVLRAQALMALGQRREAEQSLRTALTSTTLEASDRRELIVELGRVLIGMGQRKVAEPELMTVIEAYNDDVIKDEDGPGMFIVAQAAELLRSPEDANEAFNLAELQIEYHLELLLARARLFLDNYDPGHAEEILQEILAVAPNQPDALILLAEVRLDQAMDFGEATRLVDKAHKANPNHPRGYFVLAGVALRDMQLERAMGHVQKGLARNPQNLDLLSMRGATEFLADDAAALEKTRTEVFAVNPEYSRFYGVIAEYAEWEHRYEKVVEMMNSAVSIDPEDAKAHAQLGINRIRSGLEFEGVDALSRAFSLDPYNVRVHNTLNLYRDVIPKEYVSERKGFFNFRFPKLEQPVLSREVPPMLETAWGRMVKEYQFTPETPVGIELYYDRKHFAVRTSGLPTIAIQGVCFGRTLASMSPRDEQFNLGMTLWHELAHVFHIQLSHNHVPRWFTEGLAEYETLIARPEWKREQDQGLHRALRDKRIPKVAEMNEAFTHAESLEDVTVAYYASTHIVAMLAEQFGRPKLRDMLAAWGKGMRHEDVFMSVLGVHSAELDSRFAQYAKKRLQRFDAQYIPPSQGANPKPLKARIDKDPKDAEAHARLAWITMGRGDMDTAKIAVELALKADPKQPDALWVRSQLELAADEDQAALGTAREMVKLGYDGYDVQTLIARAIDAKADAAGFSAALQSANVFDPERPEPLFALLRGAAEQKDDAAELKWLGQIAPLVEHDGAVYRRLSELLTHTREYGAAHQAAESAVYADMENPESYRALARALDGLGKFADAEKAFESATLCPAPPAALAAVWFEFSGFLERRGKRAAAEKARQTEKKLREQAKAAEAAAPAE
jgi:cellulose synthase operon protein C